MPSLIQELSAAGLIEKLEGDDERLNKIENASRAVIEALKGDSSLMIRALLAGLDSDVEADDPAIQIAEEAMAEAWRSFRSVHVDPPMTIYRYVLLDACNELASGLKALILWNTAADTLPFLRLGREEAIIRDNVRKWAQVSESFSVAEERSEEFKKAPVTKKFNPPEIDVSSEHKGLDTENLLVEVSKAVGPNYRNDAHQSGCNPHFPNQAPQWAWEYADRMSELLADQFETFGEQSQDNLKGLAKQLQDLAEKTSEHYQALLSNQRTWLQDAIQSFRAERQGEHTQINTLWWCEALYSPSLAMSYRELPSILAAPLMSLDLLEELELPVSASVSYALSEAVNKLPDASFSDGIPLEELLNNLRAESEKIRDHVNKVSEEPPRFGRLSLRDLIIAVLIGNDTKTPDLIARTCLTRDTIISLPRLAQMMFRQDLAVRLAGAR